jgi:hypothetical protein
LQNKVLLQLVIDLVSILDSHEGVDGLSSQFIVDTDDCGFCDGVMLDQGGFDFGGGQTVTGDVDNIVNSASDPVVSFMITSGSITGELWGLASVLQTRRVAIYVVTLVHI